MKKIYLSVILFGITATSSMAQSLVPQRMNHLMEGVKTLIQKPALPNAENKALGTVIWSDDFSTGANWVIDNAGQASPYGWNIGTTVNTWWANFSGGITSTSGGGFAEVNNGDYYASNQAINVTYTMTSNALDIANLPANTSNSEFVTVQFEQFGALFNDGQKLQISTNGGTTWQDIFTNNDRTTFVGNNPEAVYDNPEVIRVDISSYITGNSSNVQFRFEWTSRFTGNTDPVAWTTFGWFIDDFRLETSSDNDLEAQLPYWGTDGLHYYQIPTTQIAPISFTTNALNLGTATQNNVILNVDIDGGATFSGTSPLGVNVLPGTYDSLIVSTSYTPAGVGAHTLDWSISQDEIDDVPGNNVNASESFEVNTFIYARDKGVAGGGSWNQGNGFEVGNLFDIWTDQTLNVVEVQLSTSTEVGALIYAKVYSIDPTTGDFVLEDQTDYLEVTAEHLAGTPFPMHLLNGVNLTAANQTYLVTLGSDGDGGVTNDLVVATSGTSPAQTTFYYDATDATWYYSTNTPMVRMNFNASAGLNESEDIKNVSVFPNPVNDVVNVAFNLGANSDVTVELVDVAGKVISTKTVANAEGNQTSSFNTEALNGGVYFVNITSNDSSITKKFIKQ